MNKWQYNLGSYGKKLRNFINEGDLSKENCENILKQIIACCEFLPSQLTNDDIVWYAYDLQEIIDDCGDVQYCLDENDEDYNISETNYMLEKFYDLMDSMRVWVAI